jgi:hypothetical protein
MNYFALGVRKTIRLLGASVGIFVMCLSLFAQINTGRILGTVTDQTGAVIGGASVTVTNTETGVARTLVADEAGEYVAPNLNPGKYSVRVMVPGFQAVERQNIDLEAGKDARIDAQLSPGQVTETITVAEVAQLLDTTTATVTGTLDNVAIIDLPLNGRNYQNLLSLRPGVTMRPGGGTLTTSTNGLRPEENNYYVEGLDVSEPFTGQSIMNSTLPSGDAATFLPIDAIREVNIETNAPAEFGKKPGAVINAAIKAGTNNLHGTAYAFGRSDKLDAKDYFVSAKAPTELEQWGGTAGGPIIKDKLFYFSGFERQTYSVGYNVPSITPSTSGANTDPSQSIPAAEAGLTASCLASPAGKSFCSGPGGTYVRNVVSAKILPLWAPTGGTTILQHAGFPADISIYNIVNKVDYHLSDHHSFAGSYFFGNGTSLAEDTIVTLPIFESIGHLRSQFATASWTWTPNSALVNDLRFGWNFHHRQVVTNDSTTPLSTYGINTGVTNPALGGFPTITVTGFTQIGGDQNLPKSYGPTKDYDFVDHVSLLRGKHAFKFGGEGLFARPYFGNFSAGRGLINFNGKGAFATSTPLQDFLAGVTDPSANSLILNGDVRRQLSQQTYSTFFEDSWHVLPHVTLNMGLRYEYFTPRKDSANLIGGWSPTVGLQQVGVNESSPYPSYKKDFSPRFGLAWDIGGKGKTVLRVGGGVFYASPVIAAMVDNINLPGKPSGITSIPTAYSTGADGTAPPLKPITSGGIGTSTLTFAGSALNWSSLAGPIFPANQIGPSSGFTCGDGLTVGGVKHPSTCSVLVAGPTYRPPRVEIWSLGIQHTLSNNFTLEVNYIGDYSGDLIGIQDVNAIDPTNPLENVPGTGPCPATVHSECITHRPYYAQFPYLQFINVLSNIETSNYNALQTTLTARNYHGLGFVAAYTLSHALDDSSANRNQQVPMNNLNPRLDYGPSNFDHRHHLGLTLNYDLPGKKGFGQLLEGWRINSAVLLLSGLPWTATSASQDISKTGDKKSDRWDLFGNPKDFDEVKNVMIPFYAGGSANMPAACTQAATTIGTAGPGGNLAQFGCFAQGSSALIAPPTGTFGTSSRNMFTGSPFDNWDFSLFKNTKIKERMTAQFRAEFFNFLNHPIMANASGTITSPSTFGCGCDTPDQNGQNPVLGTGGARVIQLGLKIIF